jgi:hypothetical protein
LGVGAIHREHIDRDSSHIDVCSRRMHNNVRVETQPCVAPSNDRQQRW